LGIIFDVGKDNPFRRFDKATTQKCGVRRSYPAHKVNNIFGDAQKIAIFAG
jgi:hypothetical protein